MVCASPEIDEHFVSGNNNYLCQECQPETDLSTISSRGNFYSPISSHPMSFSGFSAVLFTVSFARFLLFIPSMYCFVAGEAGQTATDNDYQQ